MEAALSTTSHSEASAFLHCEQLTSERIKTEFDAFKKWGKSNTKHILATEPATKEYGFFIVTATHCVKGCLLKCWSKTTKSVSPNLSVNTSFFPVAPTQLGGKSATGRTNSGWVTRPNDDDLRLVSTYSPCHR